MAYFPVDDDMAFHPKVLAAGNEAIGLWTRAGSLCKKHTTGGFVTLETARALGTKRTADRLVAVGLWIVEVDPVLGDGYRFHDWKQHAGNSDAATERERVEKSRERNAARQKEWRDRNRERNAVTNGAGNPPVTSGPSPSPSPMTDLTVSESSHEIPASASTDAVPGSEMTRRLAAQQGITNLGTIAAAVAQHTGISVNGDQAFQVALWILGKAARPPAAPERYVVAAIAQSPFEVQKHIHEAVA